MSSIVSHENVESGSLDGARQMKIRKERKTETGIQ